MLDRPDTDTAATLHRGSPPFLLQRNGQSDFPAATADKTTQRQQPSAREQHR